MFVQIIEYAGMQWLFHSPTFSLTSHFVALAWTYRRYDTGYRLFLVACCYLLRCESCLRQSNMQQAISDRQYAILFRLYIHTKAIKFLVCKMSANEYLMECNLHELNISLFFSSLISCVHTRWFIGRRNKLLQTTPYHIDMRCSRKVAFDTYRLSLSDNFKSDIAIVLVPTVRIVIHAISMSNIYRVSLVASCFGVNPALCYRNHKQRHRNRTDTVRPALWTSSIITLMLLF
jgi:hypothetical protein